MSKNKSILDDYQPDYHAVWIEHIDNLRRLAAYLPSGIDRAQLTEIVAQLNELAAKAAAQKKMDSALDEIAAAGKKIMQAK